MTLTQIMRHAVFSENTHVISNYLFSNIMHAASMQVGPRRLRQLLVLLPIPEYGRLDVFHGSLALSLQPQSKEILLNVKFGFVVAATAIMLTGCASMAVTKDSLAQRTSLALGMPATQFTISGRSDSGTRTDYNVTTSSGKHYACYVTGTLSMTGRVVSDAMCTEMASTKANSAAAEKSSGNGKCNALLRAAGKCK